MAFTDDPRLPNLTQWTIAFVPFGILLPTALMAAIAQPEVAYARAQFTALAALILSAPALILYVLAVGVQPLSAVWRLLWTFAMLVYLVHFYYGFELIFKGSAGAVLARQGMVVGISNFALTGVWVLDVALAWITRQRNGIVGVVRGSTHALVGVSLIVSAGVFRTGLPRLLGLGLLFVLAATVGFRIWKRSVGSGQEPLRTIS